MGGVTDRMLARLGESLARILAREVHIHGLGAPTDPDVLLAHLQRGDVLLVEGNSRISTAIKYLTQSTWSHAAMYVGTHLAEVGGPAGHCFVEADTVDGVRSVGVHKFSHLHTRICRPVGLSEIQRQELTRFVIERLGNRYDLRNVLDLARYLLPTPPVPLGMRRRMIALGSGDPTRAICSTLIAQAFQSIRYPILPVVEVRNAQRPECPACTEQFLKIRHHSLFAPRDFDVSPYFQIVKPKLVHGFDPKAMRLADQSADGVVGDGV